MPDQRRFKRIPFDGPVRIVSEVNAQLIDISLKGALLAKPANWSGAPQQAITIVVPLDGEGTTIRMEGRVAHVEDTRIGVVCEHIDVDSITHLRRLVELNTGDAELLQRELSELGR
jgi:hypothetical protein